MEKKRNCSKGAISPLFYNIFNISRISRVQIHCTYTFVKCGCSIFFLNSAILICRGMEISKHFRDSLGIRDNESRLYFQSSRPHQIHVYRQYKLHYCEVRGDVLRPSHGTNTMSAAAQFCKFRKRHYRRMRAVNPPDTSSITMSWIRIRLKMDFSFSTTEMKFSS